MFEQLEIRWIDLEPTKGAETRKKRPCVILQSNTVNNASKTVIVAPILPKHRDWAFAVNLNPSKKNGLDKKHHINLKQLRVIDISRIDNRQGILEYSYWHDIQQAIKLVFDLDN